MVIGITLDAYITTFFVIPLGFKPKTFRTGNKR